MPDSSALWLTADDEHGRAIFEAAEAHVVWVELHELEGKLTYRMRPLPSTPNCSRTCTNTSTDAASSSLSKVTSPNQLKDEGQGPAVIQTALHTRQATAMAATGDHAPTSGWWRPDEDRRPFRYMQQGEIMPSLGGSRTLWTLIQELPPSLRVHHQPHKS